MGAMAGILCFCERSGVGQACWARYVDVRLSGWERMNRMKRMKRMKRIKRIKRIKRMKRLKRLKRLKRMKRLNSDSQERERNIRLLS